MYMVKAFLLISCLATFNNASPTEPSKQDISKVVHLADRSPRELETIFSSSIIYWDLDQANMTITETSELKQKIMHNLVEISENSKKCGCPRNVGPEVCASNGKLYANICFFHCGLAESGAESITPVMILVYTRNDKSWEMCQLYKEGKEWLPKELQGPASN